MQKTETTANILSYAFSPTIIAFYAIIIFLLFPPVKSPNNVMINLFISIIFLCIFPILAILYYKRKGKVDIWVSKQNQRPPFYIVAIVGYILGSIVFYLINETTLFVLSAAYIGVTSAITIGNFFTKVSSHSAGAAGPLTALTFVYGIYAIPLYFILPFVFWSRLKLNAHTLIQLILGVIIGSTVTLIVYYLLYPLGLSGLV